MRGAHDAARGIAGVAAGWDGTYRISIDFPHGLNFHPRIESLFSHLEALKRIAPRRHGAKGPARSFGNSLTWRTTVKHGTGLAVLDRGAKPQHAARQRLKAFLNAPKAAKVKLQAPDQPYARLPVDENARNHYRL